MYVVEFPPRELVSIFASSNNIQECLFLQITSHLRYYFIRENFYRKGLNYKSVSFFASFYIFQFLRLVICVRPEMCVKLLSYSSSSYFPLIFLKSVRFLPESPFFFFLFLIWEICVFSISSYSVLLLLVIQKANRFFSNGQLDFSFISALAFIMFFLLFPLGFI